MSRQQAACPCGSGCATEPLYDARGIFAGYACAVCREQAKARFRPEVFSDPNYWTDEPIEED